MKAILVEKFGEPEVMQLREAADPLPAKGQVVVRLHAAGVNPVDTYIRAGIYSQYASFPYTPGLDGAGVIEKVGAEVKHRRVGERVYVAWSLTGTYAEKVLCNENQVHPLPEGLSFSQGAAVGVPYATAWWALFRKAQAQPGEIVLIHGASGGVGLAAVQIARAAGLRVIGTAGSEEGRRLVLGQGAHGVLNHREPGYLAGLEELTCGLGVNVVLEMLANVNLGADLKQLAMGGRVVVVGSRGTVEIDPRDAMAKEAAIHAMRLFNLNDAELFTAHAALGAGLANGTLRPVVSRELPLADAAQAHHEVMESSTLGKIVLLP